MLSILNTAFWAISRDFIIKKLPAPNDYNILRIISLYHHPLIWHNLNLPRILKILCEEPGLPVGTDRPDHSLGNKKRGQAVEGNLGKRRRRLNNDL
jgi:hypothetical protein